MPSGREAQKGPDVLSSPKPRRVIDQRNKIQRHDGADARNGHQPAGDRMRRQLEGAGEHRGDLARSVLDQLFQDRLNRVKAVP